MTNVVRSATLFEFLDMGITYQDKNEAIMKFVYAFETKHVSGSFELNINSLVMRVVWF